MEKRQMKNRVLYITDYCLTPYQKIMRAGILCEGDKILSIGGASAFNCDEPGLEVIRLDGVYGVPGFIDSHIHGAGGFDSSTAFEENCSIEPMCQVLASHGVTSFVPTIVSAPPKIMLAALNALVSQLDGQHYGSEPVGIHLEGPFINKKKHGSQSESDIMDVIDLGIMKEFISAGKGKIKTVTFAPELEGSIKLIELLLENNIIPSMGHSIAEEEIVKKAIDAGCTRCTHLFNGMPPLHQRKVTLTAVALTDDRVTIELILDGAHLHPLMVDLACRAKPKHQLIGVSDSVQAAGLVDGNYHLGTSEISVKDGRSTTLDGTLAGTTLTLEKGWHHLVTYSHMKKSEAAACFSINPAQNLKLDDRGELRPGKQADISFFEIGSNKTRMTVSKGKVIYDSQQFSQE
jgi:N-acetylglucosamine-6-phosphate deacetylase